MYRIRLGGDLPAHQRDLDSLRGMEGSRMKQVYRNLAQQYGVEWNGRRYDRSDPESNDTVNKAINHAATAVYAAARIAVAVTGTVPQLGFIHESSGHAFALDIADLFRSSVTLPVAFRAAKQFDRSPSSQRRSIESRTRKLAGKTLRQDDVIPEMIDQIKALLDVDDNRGDS
jgi:CRISPR-associated protein Cas1